VEAKEALAANRAEDTTMVARLATLAVASATWPRTAARDRSATTVVAWDTSVATATKPLRQRSATGANNLDTSPAIVPTSLLKPTKCSHKARGLIASDHPSLELLLKIVHC